MNCGLTEKISSLIDGELSPAEAREVERHVLTCTQCEEARADFLKLRSQIISFEASLPGELQNRALAKILAAGRSKPAASGARPRWNWNWGYGFAALAAIAIVALVIGLKFNRQEKQVASNFPVSVPSATVTPTPEPEPQQKTERPRLQQTPPRRPARVREPKPGEQFAAIPKDVRTVENVEPIVPERTRPADAETMTALHFEKAETLLRAFRNVQLDEAGAAAEVRYERDRAKQLVYHNMMLRREADASGDVQVASLLDSLEPILLDIANLPDKPDNDTVRVIRERVKRKNIVALLQVNSTALARALD